MSGGRTERQYFGGNQAYATQPRHVLDQMQRHLAAALRAVIERLSFQIVRQDRVSPPCEGAISQ